MADYEKTLNKNYFTRRSFKQLLKENRKFYDDILRSNYEKKSYANPAYSVKIFGDKFGQLIAYFYTLYRGYISFAFFHKIYKMEEYNKLFVDVFKYVRDKKFEYETLNKIITRTQRKDKTKDLIFRLKQEFESNFKFYQDIIKNADLDDLRYLFKYGKYITENEIKTAKFLSNYPEKKIKKLSNQIATAYVNGFLSTKKDISKKSSVCISYNIGQERIVRQLMRDMKKRKLETSIMVVSSTEVNKQLDYDHRFDRALYFDKEYSNTYNKSFEKAGKMCKKILTACSGMVFLDKFGDLPFSPKNKKECLKFSAEQQKLFQIFQNNIIRTHDKYLPRKEISFTIISFPSPEIGKQYEQIFEDIFEVNMLDTEECEHIQQKIIDSLDKADYVHIKGKGKNKTNIKVKMQKIKNPKKETNFVNCGADLNIPVGEVFTTPKLKGTNGTLHIKQTYLFGLKYIDLKSTFKDGYVVNYNCKNFSKNKDNRKYIEENLLFPHKTLPIGEFAIGTNTLAYVIAKKYNIMNLLPALIVEKMGPHFAIGDTCFTMSEDTPVFNKLDNKEITARENKKTALRKTDMRKAYTNRHTDITLPYESIKFITVVTKRRKKIDIIRNGRFVLEGTEELNKPFEK